MEEKKTKKVLRPVNQKSVYAYFADVAEKLINEEISVDRAEGIIQSLAGMNRAFALEIKFAELKGITEIRNIELKAFGEDDTTPNKIFSHNDQKHNI